MSFGKQMNRVMENAEYYPTPAWATVALLERVKFTNPVWEPAAGTGSLADVLFEFGYDVIASDLFDYGNPAIQSGFDFLTVPATKVGSVITNPPFSLAETFVTKALECAEHRVAMLQRLAFLEGQKRQALWKSTPLERVLVFSRRLSFGEVGKIPFAWYIWRQGYSGKPTIEWITEGPESADGDSGTTSRAFTVFERAAR